MTLKEFSKKGGKSKSRKKRLASKRNAKKAREALVFRESMPSNILKRIDLLVKDFYRNSMSNPTVIYLGNFQWIDFEEHALKLATIVDLSVGKETKYKGIKVLRVYQDNYLSVGII